MKLNIYPWGICRTPVFSMDSKISEVWPRLKKFISYSSSTFYNRLSEHGVEEVGSLSGKTKFTLWKYFNRARFRATPYGEFAAFTLLPISPSDGEDYTAALSASLTTHKFRNWTSTISPTERFAEVKSNVSYYKTGDEIRYIKSEDDIFYLASVGYNPLVFDLLVFCNTKQDKEALYSFLTIDKELSMDSAVYFVQQLIEEQLVFTNMYPNIIGTDYFTRVGDRERGSEGKPYILAERKLIAGCGSFDEKVLQNALNFLAKHVENRTSETLIQFKRSFSKRYETKVVPLLTVLDPEIGVGYGDFSGETVTEQLIDALYSSKQSGQPSLRKEMFSELDYYILNQIQLGVLEIDLSKFNDELLDCDVVLPNTFSAIVEKVGKATYLKAVGGSNAASLSGRFTLASQELQEVMQSLVKIEEDANPDILFFDIAYNGERKVDNINRRLSIYNYELPILSWSTSDHVIDINDVYVTIRGDDIILYSRSYRRRIVPRLATAYNYTRSDLSLFRFLTDLQHQGVQSNLTYDIQDVFPNLDFYPRVVYQSVIISPARWRVPKFIYDYKRENHDEALQVVDDWLSCIKIGDHFVCKEGDQTLLFTKHDIDDMKAFLMYLSGKKNMYIEEGLIAESSAVVDEKSNEYKAEFVLNFWHDRNIYKSYNTDFPEDDRYVEDLFLPGDRWIYYELYCHSIRANELLLSCVHEFIEANNEIINKWFFIRYNDPSYHIRLRIEMKEDCVTGTINSAFNSVIRDWVKFKKVSEIKIKSYKREIGRYGAKRIEEVEEYFYYDSEFVLEILHETNDVYELYAVTMYFIECVLSYANYDLERQFRFAKSMGDIFADEHGIDKEGFKLINGDYNKKLRTEKGYSSLKDLSAVNLTIIKAGKLIRNCEEQKKDSLAADLFHMHINRLFRNDGRMHELIVYQFLSLKLKGMIMSKIRK